MSVTVQEHVLLAFLAEYVHAHGVAPTLREAAEHFDTTLSTIHERLDALQRKGHIRRWAKQTRGIEIVSDSDRIIGEAVARVAGPDDQVRFGGVAIHAADVIRVLTTPAAVPS